MSKLATRLHMENHKIIERYPWMCPERDDNGKVSPDYDFDYTWLYAVPFGWEELVLNMCEEIRAELIRQKIPLTRYALAEVKEKYFALAWYDYMIDYSGVPQEIFDITHKYFIKSKETCYICGAPKSRDQEFCDKCTHYI